VTIAVENFFKYRHILEAVKGKGGTHMGTGGTAPYYYLWSHMYLSMAIQQLPAEQRDKYATRVRDLFLKDQEGDGAFSDWPRCESHKVYGSAIGAIALYHLGTLPRKRGE
jgi:hypothetical protein